MNEVKYVLQVNIEDFNGQSEGDILGLKFENIEQKTLLQKALPKITKPLMIIGSGKDDVDKTLLPELISVLDRNCIICSANENTYKAIVPKIGEHKLVLKTPIDINLCKELNILSSEFGLGLDKIIIDSDIGGLGYGLEYGYSMIEKIKLENDKYLNMPIISFAPIESLKTKEAKSDTFSKSWGSLEMRRKYFQIAAASAAKAAGADIIVVESMEGLVK